jgi:hypothetical protein
MSNETIPSQSWGQSVGTPLPSDFHRLAPRNATGTWAFVLGLTAVVLFWVPILYLLTSVAGGIVAIVLAVRARRLNRVGMATNGGLSTAALVLGIIGVSLAGLNMLLGAIAGALSAIS